MESQEKISFQDWIYLQKCFKYEKLRLSHGNLKTDDIEKKHLLKEIEDKHKEFYLHQLVIREHVENVKIIQSKSRKVLVKDSHALLGDTFRYVEGFLFHIRQKPEIFNFIATSLKQCRDPIDSCTESFSYSFFLDLVHPEKTEEDLLNRTKSLIESELLALKTSGSGHISAILHESLVLRNMLRHYLKRRNQRKYMKLIFKKGLREIINNQDVIKSLKLDPKVIYAEVFKKEEKVEPAHQSLPVGRRSIFRRDSKSRVSIDKQRSIDKQKSKENPTDNISTEDAMHNEDVYRILVERSSQVIVHCKILLQGIYDNIDTMPFGLRWICKQMIFLIQTIFPSVGEVEKHTLLGNFLFTLWWVPAIFDPIKNGLLQNVIIQNSTLSYFKLIGNIFKNIIKANYFDEFQYFKINEFIADESSKMRQFLNDIVSFDESIYDKSKVKAYECEKNEVPYERNLKTMMFYYKNKVKQPFISTLDHITKSKNHLEEEKNMKDFKIVTFVVTLNDIKLLARIVKEKEDQISEKGWNDFLRYGKTIRNSDELGTLINFSYLKENNLTEQDELHCFFMKKDFGGSSAEIENSYTAVLKKSRVIPGDNKSLKLLIKVQEAIRNLLISLDMSLFFDPNKEWSLSDIIEFVMHFSYLFENKSGQEGIPLKLLAQFLSTYLEKIPADFTVNSFRKLYKTLFADYEDRCEVVKGMAAKNKRLLLLSMNFLEKNVNDLRQEVRVFEVLKQKSFAVEFIKNRKVPVCLLTIPDKDRPLAQLWSQTCCPHSKLASVSEFVLGSKKSIKTIANPDNTHINSIEEFTEKFMKLPQVEMSLFEEEDKFNVSSAFFEYLNVIEEMIKKELENDDQKVEMAMEEIEKHLTSTMFAYIFPVYESKKDRDLYWKTFQHSWVKPEHLDIVESNRDEAMWKFAIETLQSLDIYRSPADKLNCFVTCMSIIVNVLSLMSDSGSGVGTDDSLPLIIYIIIRAQPKRLHSNLTYIYKFRHQSKMIGMKGFVFQQFQSATSFIEELDERSLTIEKSEYKRMIRASKLNNN
jgi:hypothetical protein